MVDNSDLPYPGRSVGPCESSSSENEEAMAQQKSERRVVAKAAGNLGQTGGSKSGRGAKATLVRKQIEQLALHFDTAEKRSQERLDASTGGRVRLTVGVAGPKPKYKEKKVVSTTMAEVCEQLDVAFQSVARNKGSPGPDRQSIEQVREHWPELRRKLGYELLSGGVWPGDIRRVWIPKGSGGQRRLGIPNVIDRVVQEAVRRVLEPVCEPTFHDASHGFRPGRSCHTAVKAAATYLEEGYEWVVGIDLENYFGTVNH